MITQKLRQMFLVLTVLTILSLKALAVDPGLPFPDTSQASDQRAGSVLLYNIYASSSINPTAENTRLNITNTNSTTGVYLHLFFIDGRTCSVADSYLCLSKSQTTSLLASDIDPDVVGYVIGIAVDGDGVPIKFNYLIGGEYIKLISGHTASLSAEAVPAIDLSSVAVTPDATVTIKFDNVMYSGLARVLAVDSLTSARDGNETILIINRVEGSLLTGGTPIGPIFGIMYDALEVGVSYSFSPSSCQLKASYSDSFPRTTPRYSSVISAGNTGWTKFWGTSDKALMGAIINRNTTSSPSSFNNGHNLHKLTMSKTGKYEIPVFTAMCS